MKCTRVEKFLPLYAAGDLGGRRRERAVEKHLAACEPCRRTAAEYGASRELFRAAALSPDFDGAFYEELRNSVLARIRRDRTLAPPSRFSALFNARFAYAASLALILIAAALALHGYTRRTPEDGARQKFVADANQARPATPATIKTPTTIETPATIQTPAETRTQSDERPTTPPFDESARGTTTMGGERRASRSSLPNARANVEQARSVSSRSLHTTTRAPANARLNPPAPTVAARAARGNTGEIAAKRSVGRGNETKAAQPEVSRIEIQTSDPNIRIIWLSPHAEDAARPLK
jgi:anti-sigma factor RsiW